MLSRIALRVCVQEALRDGSTLAGNNVLDSQFAALDVGSDGSIRTDQDRPFYSVYTDGGRIGAGNGFLSLFGEPTVELVIEAGISAAMLEQDPDSGQTQIIGIGLPDTDANMELTVDLMMRQAADVLTAPNMLWADMAREFLGDVKSIERSRIGQKVNGTRLAAQEMRITANLLQDPVRGTDLTGTLFARFLDALQASGTPRLLKIKAAFAAEIAGDQVEWAVLQRELGQTDGQSVALAFRPLATDTGEPGSWATVKVEVSP